MITSLADVLTRQVRAAESLQARLRALELIVAAREQRFLSQALDEVETAAEHLAGLELTRSLALTAMGLPADVAADELIDRLESGDATPADDTDDLRVVVERLRAATTALDDARERTTQAVRAAAAASGQRRQAAAALVAV